MKIAAISDIHSNIYALQRVLGDIKRRGVDVTVNLGDILYGPIEPKATYELLMENELVTIRGNQDRQIYEASQEEIETNPTMQFILKDLGEQPLIWMKNLPFSMQLTDQVFLCHGTPNNDLIYFLESVETGSTKVRNDEDIIKLLAGQTSDVILCGHTHTPRAVTTSTKQLIVNPGSVGLPAYVDDLPVAHSIENHSPHATYAILELVGTEWNVQHIRVPYDHEKAARAAELRGREDWVHFLLTGRAE